MPDPLTLAFLLVLVLFGPLDAYLTMRIFTARARAWHKHRRTRRWVRHLPARPVSVSDAAGRAGTPPTAAGMAVTSPPHPAVSAVSTSTRVQP